MAITIIVTNAGRAALINAVNTGTNAVTITQLGITEADFVPGAAQVALPGEIKRVPLASGVVVADDQIHVTASDVTTDAYAMRGFALYLNDGTLFAIYGQAGAILNKTAQSMMLLAADIAFADIDAELIEFGDTNFILPPATTEILGLVELATTAEGQAGADATRVLTPLTGKQSVLGWLLSQDGSGSGLDADMLDGFHASAFAQAGHTHGSMAEQNSDDVNISGGAISGTTLSNIAGPVGIACAALGSTKLQVRIGADRRFSVFANGPDSVFGYLTDAGNWADTFLNGSLLRFGIGGTERVRIDASGFLGINQPAPVARLHVKSGSEIARFESTAARGTGQCYITLADPIGSKGYIGFANADDGMDVHNGMNGPIRFVTNGTEALRIAPTGDTIIPAAKSHTFISGDYGIGTPDVSGLQIFVNPASEIRFGARQAGAFTEQMKLNGVGLGIGIAPSVRLHVRSTTEIARFETTTARGGGNGFIGIGDPSGRKAYFGYGGVTDDLYIINEVNRNIALGTASQVRLTLDTTGHLTPASHGTQILGWPSAAWKEGYFTDFVRVAGNNVWHSGNDGAGSGLDADLLDGQQGSYYLPAASYTAADVRAKLLTVDGAGTGLDADLLDGQQGSYYLPAASYTAADVRTKLITVDGSGSGIDADLLDGYHASSFDRIVEQNLTDQGGYIVYASGRKECWGTLYILQDSYATWNLPIAHSSWCHPSFTYTGKIGTNNTGDNTMFAGFIGAPPSALRFWNAEDIGLTIYVRTIGV